MKKVFIIVQCVLVMLACAGCGEKGLLHTDEEVALMTYLVNENYIDDFVAVEPTETNVYKCHATVCSVPCELNIQHLVTEQGFRVFHIWEDDDLYDFNVVIQPQTHEVKLYL